jgi:IS30 family transposase
MSEKYHRLYVEDHKVIHNMNKGGFGQAEIGQSIGFGQSAVSKELSRNILGYASPNDLLDEFKAS